MNQSLFENTKLAAYFLWEKTKVDNTLNLWNCAEDIACYLEQSDILAPDQILDILTIGKYDARYIQFVRHVAFRIHLYTGQQDAPTNWYDAEALLENGEWRSAVAAMALIYNQQKHQVNGLIEVHSGQIKSFYDSQSLAQRQEQ
ncbi:MAG: hypothetical protein LBU32_17020 [Clostridiales bacterium]|nr:hypothetical protein [Clostridiales bacterium]